MQCNAIVLGVFQGSQEDSYSFRVASEAFHGVLKTFQEILEGFSSRGFKEATGLFKRPRGFSGAFQGVSKNVMGVSEVFHDVPCGLRAFQRIYP